MQGREQIIDFLTKKWAKEDGYRLRKELFAFTDNCIAVQVCVPMGIIPATNINLRVCSFGTSDSRRSRMGLSNGTALMGSRCVEPLLTSWPYADGHCDSQDWTFNEDGLMKKRQMSGNDVKITDEQRALIHVKGFVGLLSSGHVTCGLSRNSADLNGIGVR